MTDTPPEIAALVREKLMQHSASERFRMGVEMFEAARRVVLASFPPDLSEPERRRRLFERIYGFPIPFDPDRAPAGALVETARSLGPCDERRERSCS